MPDCTFCKIVQGELPSSKIFEDEDILAFLDITPINPGHTLIIPKLHYDDLRDMSDPLIGRLFSAAAELAPAICRGVGAKDFNLGMNNGMDAGQVVFHAHAHIMPRFPDDGLELWSGKKYAEGEQERVHEKIMKEMK
ncbi:MAG TPA: HIT family protein [Candidatus Nanoarchaeia archaeon]|nr:HIT family protein [Candidatus Nanoarchaeia archaeon]